MPAKSRERAVEFGLAILALIVLLPGINWGLPSRAADRFLFPPPAQPWTGAQIQAAGGAWTPNTSRPAEADANPQVDRTRLIALNGTAEKQAEILRRYRLFTHHPDEMLTFMGLSGMRGGSFDPRMYHYGGLWFYPVGAMLKIASLAGMVHVTPDLNYYLDHPEAFGRFYIVARLYSTLWAVVGAWAVFRLTRRFAARLLLPFTAAACFIFLPIVINGAHEAKPHLAGAVLTLLMVLAATKYIETGERRWWVVAGVLCGAAIGMVLSALVAIVVLPLMVLFRSDANRLKTLIAAGAVAVAVYCVTNPYVPINLVRNPSLIRESLAALGQAKALTGQTTSDGAIRTAARLISDGASPPLAILGSTGILAIVLFAGIPRLRRREPLFETTREKAGALLAVPALLGLAQFAWFAAGKPGEYGRFALLPDILFAIAAVAWRPPLIPERFRAVGASVLIGVTALFGLAYLAAFVDDTTPRASRTIAAEQLQALAPRAFTIGIPNDPAPYNLPPVDLDHWKLFLLPTGGHVPTPQPALDVIVRPVDAFEPPGPVPGTPYTRLNIRGPTPWLATPISWADKPFEILVRQELLAAAAPQPPP